MPRRRTTARQPKYEVISIRVTKDRMQLLTRYRDFLVATRGHPVSLGAAVFSALKREATEPLVERAVARHEVDQRPTVTLHAIRRAWHRDRRLAAAEWAFLADYVHAGTDTDQQPVHATTPTPAACRTLLDAFEAVYRHRSATASGHQWLYEDGTRLDAASVTEAGGDRVLARLTRLRQDPYLSPAALARHASLWFQTAVRHEGVPPVLLDRYLCPHWPILWRLAARGHWLRHQRPVRPDVLMSDAPPWPPLPAPARRGAVTLAFEPTGPTSVDFVTTLTFGDAPPRVGLYLLDYLKLLEFQALLAAPADCDWQGRYFGTRPSTRRPAARTLLIPNAYQGTHLDLFPAEWDATRQLLEDAWRDPFLQARIEVLADEYGAPV